MIFDTFLMALSAIARNKIRSLLTSLGVIIGVGSVIAMIHLGQSASRNVTSSISSLGTNMLIIRVIGGKRDSTGARRRTQSFTMDDVDALRQGIPDLTVSPLTGSTQLLTYGSASRTGSISGVTNDYLAIRAWTVSAGRMFDQAEVDSGAAVCILGNTIVEDLYVDRDPIGTTLRLGRSSCKIVGTLRPKGDAVGGDQDDVVLMPYKAVQKRLTGRPDVHVIFASVKNVADTDRTKSSIEKLLRTRRKIQSPEDDDFEVRDLQQFVDALRQVTTALTALLGAIAAISLLVGGIGIMNIMLVSVTERTREIGVRLAIGATARDVQLQFLVEASIISAIGGVIGIAFGIGATALATAALEFPFVLSWPAIFLSFGFSAFIGVIFGFVPARKAAHLNPIEALRHE